MSIRESRFRSLLERWQPLLGLADWDIRLDPRPSEVENRASVEAWGIKRMAAIRLSADLPDDQMERPVVHELLHVWIDQMWEEVSQLLMAYTPPHVDKIAEELWDRRSHQLIHVLEGALTGKSHVEWGDAPAWVAPWRAEKDR